MNLCPPYSELFSTKEIECETEHKWKAGFYHCTETTECILLLNVITNAGKKTKIIPPSSETHKQQEITM
jgi:hypothetical protein